MLSPLGNSVGFDFEAVFFQNKFIRTYLPEFRLYSIRISLALLSALQATCI